MRCRSTVGNKLQNVSPVLFLKKKKMKNAHARARACVVYVCLCMLFFYYYYYKVSGKKAVILANISHAGAAIYACWNREKCL